MDYPNDGKKFPKKIVDLNLGDIVLFPSSLFHSTIPFNSNQRRITLAFDVIPEKN
jgi:ectoine hydroxylase-related dioxygenase (phytanoyl-CoA dioxygenase family)